MENQTRQFDLIQSSKRPKSPLRGVRFARACLLREGRGKRGCGGAVVSKMLLS